ncbi:MAG: SLC13 family permease [Pseudomonadota bacterium]
MTETLALTFEMSVVIGFLAVTVFLFVFEVVRVDVVAILVMVALGLTSLVPGLEELVDPQTLFNGFSSNAVISIMAVMVIGAGLDRAGIMQDVANLMLKYGGMTEKRILPLISGTVGVISSFMQNVGAAALFLPVVSRISSRTGIALSRLLMPMGFCAILGGTMTMVGSSPLILLNDLLATSNETLPADQQMQPFSLFSVTPIGVALITTGVLYFVYFGKHVLPNVKAEDSEIIDTTDYFQKTYGIGYDLHEVRVLSGSPLIGALLEDIEGPQKIRVVGLRAGDTYRIGAGALARDVGIQAGDILAVIGDPQAVAEFEDNNRLYASADLRVFSDALSPARAGIAEIVIPPSSNLVGKSAREVWMRKTYGVSCLAIRRGDQTIREGEGVRDLAFQSGDTLVVHTEWSALARLKSNRNFVIITTEYPHEEIRTSKEKYALVFFALALGLILFSDLRLSVSLLVGAVGMVISGVLSIDEAYEAISWKTVFLLASLIPLGMAMETSGTAAWIAQQTLIFLGDVPVWVLQTVVAVLATFFTLVMSNVGATVLLVPLAVNIAIGAGGNPAIFALTVAIATSNSFLIPTHQVNALVLGPGGYSVKDFMRAGLGMTILFLLVSLVLMNLIF